MIVKAINIVKRAMRLVNALGAGQTPSGEDQEDALQILNGILDQWSLERWMQPVRQNTSFTLVPGVGIYNLGTVSVPPPNTITMVKPIRIEDITIAFNANSSYPLKYLNEAEYAVYINKLQSGDPRYYAYRATQDELGILYILPIPVLTSTINLWSWVPFLSFANIDSEIYLAPGVEKAIRYALAVEMAPEWTGKEVLQSVYIMAEELKANVKRINAVSIKYPKDMVSNLDPRRSQFDILRGGW